MKIFVFSLLIFSIVISTAVFSQNPTPNTNNSLNFDLFTKSSDKVKIVVLPFEYSNMSAALAEAYGNELALSILQHTNFQIITPKEIKLMLAERGLDVDNCNKINCAKMAADEIVADYFLISQITVDNNIRFNVSTKLIANVSQDLILEENLKFDRDSFDESFFELSNKIKVNIPLNARIIRFNQNRVIINIGSNQGLKAGDRLVSYHKPPQQIKQGPTERPDGSYDETNTTIIYGPNLDMIAANILIVEQVLPDSSSANYLLSNNMISRGDLVKTYLDKNKQNVLVADARKNIDRYYQFAPDIKKQPLPTFETFATTEKILDYDKVTWIKKVRQEERKREIYRWASLILGIGAALTFIDITKAWPGTLILGAATGYAFVTFLDARSNVEDLVNEGKFKNYLDIRWPEEIKPATTPNSKDSSQLILKNIVLLSYNVKF